jgi:hypothetical protein
MRNPDATRHVRKTLALPALPATAFAVALLAAPGLAIAQNHGSETSASSGGAMAQHEASAETHAETIDQRITSLHEELKITPAEESDWNAVAQTMRDNASAMEKLASEKQAQSEKGMTAVEDLQTYGEFAEAHVEHLKKLTSAFETLYNAMPEQQKKVADQVFARSQREEQSEQSEQNTGRSSHG